MNMCWRNLHSPEGLSSTLWSSIVLNIVTFNTYLQVVLTYHPPVQQLFRIMSVLNEETYNFSSYWRQLYSPIVTWSQFWVLDKQLAVMMVAASLLTFNKQSQLGSQEEVANGDHVTLCLTVQNSLNNGNWNCCNCCCELVQSGLATELPVLITAVKWGITIRRCCTFGSRRQQIKQMI